MIKQESSVTFPLWFTVLTVVLIISNLFVFGITTLLYPTLAFMESDSSAAFPIQFFAVRHIAFSIPLLHGLITKNPTILRALYSVFIIISVLDISLLIINDYYIPFIGNFPIPVKATLAIGAFFVPMAIGLRHLRGYES